MSEQFNLARLSLRDVVIPSGQSLSAPVSVGVGCVIWIDTPAGLNCAQLNFLGGNEVGQPRDLQDPYGNPIALFTPTRGQRHSLSMHGYSMVGLGSLFVWVRAVTAGSPVAQAADRVLTIAIWNPY